MRGMLISLAVGFVSFLVMWTLSIFGSSTRTGILDDYTPEINFITVLLTSPLNGQRLKLTLDSMIYCVSNQNQTISLADLGIADSYGRGLLSWVLGRIVRRRIPQPATLRNGCWPWNAKIFKSLDTQIPEIALIAIQSLEFAAFALAILGTFLIVYYALLCCDGTEDSEPSPKEQPSSPESEAALSSDDNISDIALNATAAGTPSSDSQPRRRQLIIFTVLTTVLFLVALGSLIIKSLFLFTISNMPGISLETSDAAPFIAAANATRPSSFAFMYIISGRNVGPSFILSIMSCILLFSMIHVQILGVLPEADDEKEKKSNSTGATVASAVSRTKPDQTKDGLRSAMRRSQCSPLQSISARSSFSFSSRTLNRSGDVSPAFPLNQDIPASAHFHTISMEDGWFGGGNSSVFSWWVGMKLSMVRLMRRLAGQQPSARTDRMFVGGGKKKVRIVEPFDQV